MENRIWTAVTDYDAIVYDLDGTLVHLAVDWQAVGRDLGRLLREADVNPDGLETWELLDAAEDAGVGDDAETIISDHEREGAAASDRLPLANDLVENESGQPAAVCSLNCEDACRIALDEHDLLPHVETVVGRDSVPTRKPDPEPLLTAIRALGAEPERTLFVGDSESDEVTANRAGTDFRYV